MYKVALVMQEYTQSGGVRSVFNYIKIINCETVGKVNYSLRILPFFQLHMDLHPDFNLNFTNEKNTEKCTVQDSDAARFLKMKNTEF